MTAAENNREWYSSLLGMSLISWAGQIVAASCAYRNAPGLFWITDEQGNKLCEQRKEKGDNESPQAASWVDNDAVTGSFNALLTYHRAKLFFHYDGDQNPTEFKIIFDLMTDSDIVVLGSHVQNVNKPFIFAEDVWTKGEKPERLLFNTKGTNYRVTDAWHAGYDHYVRNGEVSEKRRGHLRPFLYFIYAFEKDEHVIHGPHLHDHLAEPFGHYVWNKHRGNWKRGGILEEFKGSWKKGVCNIHLDHNIYVSRDIPPPITETDGFFTYYTKYNGQVQPFDYDVHIEQSGYPIKTETYYAMIMCAALLDSLVNYERRTAKRIRFKAEANDVFDMPDRMLVVNEFKDKILDVIDREMKTYNILPFLKEYFPEQVEKFSNIEEVNFRFAVVTQLELVDGFLRNYELEKLASYLMKHPGLTPRLMVLRYPFVKVGDDGISTLYLNSTSFTEATNNDEISINPYVLYSDDKKQAVRTFERTSLLYCYATAFATSECWNWEADFYSRFICLVHMAMHPGNPANKPDGIQAYYSKKGEILNHIQKPGKGKFQGHHVYSFCTFDKDDRRYIGINAKITDRPTKFETNDLMYRGYSYVISSKLTDTGRCVFCTMKVNMTKEGLKVSIPFSIDGKFAKRRESMTLDEFLNDKRFNDGQKVVFHRILDDAAYLNGDTMQVVDGCDDMIYPVQKPKLILGGVC